MTINNKKKFSIIWQEYDVSKFTKWQNMFCCIITGNKHLFITIKQKMTNVEVLCILSLGWLTGARWWTFSLKFPMKLIMCNFCDSLSIFDNWNGRDKVNINRKIVYCPSQIYKPGSYMLKFQRLLVDITVYYFLYKPVT